MKYSFMCLMAVLVGCSSNHEPTISSTTVSPIEAPIPKKSAHTPQKPITAPLVKKASFDELFGVVSNVDADFERRVEALEKLLSGSFNIPENDSWNNMKQAKNKYDAVFATYQELSSFSVEDLPGKPEYSPPKYSGTYLISGTYGGRFKDPDGIWIEANDHIYIIEDAEVRGFFSYTHGYVEDTGRTVWANIGRGREAKVVRLMDHASYVDDQKSFALEQAQYEKDYRKELSQYQEVRRNQQAQLVKFAQVKTKTEAELKIAAEGLVKALNSCSKKKN